MLYDIYIYTLIWSTLRSIESASSIMKPLNSCIVRMKVNGVSSVPFFRKRGYRHMNYFIYQQNVLVYWEIGT